MIGLGIVTFNRPEYLRQCLKAALDNDFGVADVVYVYDDGSSEENLKKMVDILREVGDNSSTIFHCSLGNENKGVAYAKNQVLKTFMDMKLNHIFIMEDDILITNPKVCKYYIEYAKAFKLHHLNFALHGDMNKGKASTYNGITVYPNCVGAFSYYTRECIDKVGYMDENFKNAWEHVEHTYRIVNAGMTTPFWKFADCYNSDKLLSEIPDSIINSSIRPRKDWEENILKGQKYWIKKHGCWLPPRI